VITSENDYHVKVFTDPAQDGLMSPAVRALHAELCRPYPHTPPASLLYPACWRAWVVVRRYQIDKA